MSRSGAVVSRAAARGKSEVMTSRTQYHVVPDGSGWKVEHGSTVDSTHRTKNEAIEAGRQVAKGNQPSQVVIHTADGKIETEYTYQDDPFPPAG